MGDKRHAYRILVGKPDGNRILGRPNQRQEYDIKIELKIERMRWYGLN
jgi:hypothetical protein